MYIIGINGLGSLGITYTIIQVAKYKQWISWLATCRCVLRVADRDGSTWDKRSTQVQALPGEVTPYSCLWWLYCSSARQRSRRSLERDVSWITNSWSRARVSWIYPEKTLAFLIYLVELGLHGSGQTKGGSCRRVGPDHVMRMWISHCLASQVGAASSWLLGPSGWHNPLEDDVPVPCLAGSVRVSYPCQ